MTMLLVTSHKVSYQVTRLYVVIPNQELQALKAICALKLKYHLNRPTKATKLTHNLFNKYVHILR